MEFPAARFASAAEWNFRADFPFRECRGMEFPDGFPALRVSRNGISGRISRFASVAEWNFRAEIPFRTFFKVL